MEVKAQLQSILFKKRLGQDSSLLKENRRKVLKTESGVLKLDKHLGLRGMVGIVGEPKTFKSTFALQVAAHNLRLGNPVYWVDRENGKARINDALMVSHYDKPFKSLYEQSNFNILQEKLVEFPFYYTNENATFEDLKADVDELYRIHPKQNALVVIDSLQSLRTNFQDIRLSIDEWLLNLDDLKLKYEGRITIFLICEKRRGTYGEANIDSAKESGRIEYKLEQQLDFRYDQESGDTILECTLNRFGPRGFKVQLQPVLDNPNDPESFLFKLKERKILSL